MQRNFHKATLVNQRCFII